MMGDHWPRMTSLTWNCNFYLGQDDLTWPSYRITVSRWWWWSYLCLYHVAPVSLPPTVVCQCVSNIITSRLLALCMLMSWTNHPVVLLVVWRQRAREREREMCDVGETVNTSPEHRDHSNIRRSVLQLPREQAMGRYWLDYWEDIPVIIRLSSALHTNISSLISVSAPPGKSWPGK